MDKQHIIDWLLEGDISIQYQVNRDLLGVDRKDLRARIATEGWAKQLLSLRGPNGHWGESFYQPKWISTHYTLLELRHLNPSPINSIVSETLEHILSTSKSFDGGIRLGPSTKEHSDVCVNGMFLNYATYFQAEEQQLRSVVDSLLNEIMPDGGFNCRSVRSGATHSSMHSTISVLEGFSEYLHTGYTYRNDEIRNAIDSAEEFLLIHQLYKSDHTGEIIKDEFIRLPFPSRWKYDILRALDYFQLYKRSWDLRMESAIHVLLDRRNKDGTWNLAAAHPGKAHFAMEKAGKPSRWNTLRAMRVLQYFGKV